VARVATPVVTAPFRHSTLRVAEAIPPTCGTRQTGVPQVALRSVAVLLGGQTRPAPPVCCVEMRNGRRLDEHGRVATRA